MNWNKTNTILAVIVSAAVLGTALGSVLNKIDDRYASAEEFTELRQFAMEDAKRLEQHTLQDKYDFTQRMIWDLETKYPNRQDMDEETKEIYQNLKLELDKVREDLKKLSEKKESG